MTLPDNREHRADRESRESRDRTSTTPAGPGAGDIAVVGVGMRYAGGVHDLDSLWQVILGGRNVTSPVPEDRWDPAFLDRGRADGTMYCGRGGFIDDVDAFDARFFGITPREAAEIDPQHRLLLRTAWEAMEDSGVPRDRWEGTRTGVYTGILGMDYTLLHTKTNGPTGIGPYYASGKEPSFGAGRIAYTFGLHGPCMMLSTACSSSLLAVHLACQSLRSGECDAALAGGVNLMLTPELSIYMSRIEALSPTETCRPFDTAADGVVRGEGCGMVVLKRYTDAMADGDRIHAVLKGSATVHDGRSSGLIAPNAEAQEMLLRAALRAAGLTPHDIDFVETHCTGTPLGDCLEVNALTSVFGADRDPRRPLLVGSHKANFGHTDSAAGVLGLLKGILVARHGTVPPQINVDQPIDLFADGGLRVSTEATALPDDRPRLVGVSAFGLSGTNVHVVVQSPPAVSSGRGAADNASEGEPLPEPVPVLVLSGPSPEAVTAQATAYREVFAAAGSDDLPGLLHNASVRRTHHDYRLAVTGTTGDALVGALTARLTGETPAGSALGDVLGGRAPRIVHAFSGQGTQWPGMAMDLYRTQPVVRGTLDECAELVREFADWSLLEEIGRSQGSRLQQTEIAQPAVFAVQVALSRLWTSWGLAPTAVVGHSVGEIAAAHTAGTLELRDAVRLVVDRGRIMQGATGSGRMTQVELPADEVRAALRPLGGEVVVATVNGPHSVVVAGPADAMERAVAHLKRIGATCLPLGVDYAFHSPAVHSHGDELERLLAGLTPAPARIPLLSSVDPEAIAPVTDAAYWGRNVRDAVQFWLAVDRRLAERDALFIEIGPHPVLTRPLRDALAHRGRSGTVVASLARGKSGPLTLAASLAALHPLGAPVDWRAVHPARGGSHITLPPVPLARDRHWLAGVPRGVQSTAVVPAPAVALPQLTAEVRLFDAEQRLVATIADLPLTLPEPGAAPAVVPAAEAAPAPVAVPTDPGPQPAPTDPPTAAGSGQTAREVGRIAAEVLGVPGQRLSRVRGFYELGFDSFSMVELVTRLGEEFGVDLPAGSGLEHPSIDAMTEHILAEAAAHPTSWPAVAEQVAEPANEPATPAASVPVAAAPTGRVPQQPLPADPLPVRPEPGGALAADGVEPIAIVGMSCRLPGATGLDAYWKLLSQGVDATTDVPEDRWDAKALLDSSGGAVGSGRTSTGRGGFIDGIDQFDRNFFRVSAREARTMDPQQRIFLEVAWEALEDAGLSAEKLRGGRAGLFVGLNTVDYGQLVSSDPEQVDLYYGTGNTFSGTAGRLSYFLGVRGPSLAVDTACSSSLTAVHLGCQSLRSGESEVAVVGGSNALLTPTVYLSMSAGGALAPDGRCKTFDASADGYGRGEGAGAVILKTLSRARADGDRIYAVIRGSAVNHNGASGGLTVPSADAQAEVIGSALAQGGVDPAHVDYVEAHGTGTPLGDPIELTALDRVIGAHRPDGRSLLVGSVKTNIGHLEAAAGIAGLIKTVLALGHGEIPPHLHFNEPSPQVAWDRLRVSVADRATAWPKSGRARTAGVSAFGFTGTNAHVVLSEPPADAPSPARSAARPYALAVSAANPAALDEATERLAAHLAGSADAEPADLSHTLGVRRSHLEHRLVAVGATREELAAALRTAAVTGTARVGEPARFAAVFGPAVARLPWDRLYAAEPAFAAALDSVEAASLTVLGHSVRAALAQGGTDAVTGVGAQIALAALWADLGVRPDALAARGTGEVAAAHVAGVLSLRDAVAAAGGMTGVRLSGTPALPLHLASAPADLSAWTSGSLADFGPALADRLLDDGVERLLDVGLTDTAAELTLMSEELAAVDGSATGPGPHFAARAAGEYDLALDASAFVRAAAALHAGGSALDWDALLAGRGRHVSAPGYPWQHRRHWIDVPQRAVAARAAEPVARELPALGAPVVPYDTPTARYYPVRGGSQPVGAAAMAGLLLAAGRDLLGSGAPLTLRQVAFATPLIAPAALTPDAGAQLAARRAGNEWTLSLIAGRHGGRDSTPVATATLTGPNTDPRPPVDPAALRARLTAPVPGDGGYELTALTQGAGPNSERLAVLRSAGGGWASEAVGELLGGATGLLGSCLAGQGLVVTAVEAVRVYGVPGESEVLVHAVAEGDDTGQVRVLAADGRVLAELVGVRYESAASPVPEEVRQRVGERLYTVRWQRAEMPVPAAASGTPRWLVAAAGPADSAAAGGLAAALTGAGADARTVDGTPDWTALLAAGGLAGIALAATAPTGEHEPGGAAAEAALAAARAVAGTTEPPRLWLITRGAQDPEGTTAPDRGQAAAWGLARVLAMETPAAWGGALDLGALTEREYSSAAAVLLARETGPGRTVEDELALRDGAVHVPRLVRADAPPEVLPALRCRRDGWYVVAGALTAAVRPVIDRLVAAGARRLLVVRPGGGAAPAGPDAGWAEELSLAGVDLKVVDLAPGDFAPPAPTADGRTGATPPRVLADATGGEPLAGLIVAPAPPAVTPLTGVRAGQPAVGQALADVAALLESGLRGVPLDFFYVLGSAAASWGSAGMGQAGALDGALSAVAAARRAAGQAAAVLRWMPRADTGELARRDRLMMESSGLTALTAEDAGEAAEVLLRGGYTDAAVARVDEKRYADACREQTPRGFLELLGGEGAAPGAAEGAGDGPAPLVAELLALDPQLRGGVLLERVLWHVTDVLGEDIGGEADPDRGFFELGMDSVMAVALKTRLDEELSVDLPATLTFEFPTGRALARHLLDGLEEQTEPEGVPEEAAPSAAGSLDDGGDGEDDLDSLSDDELLERLTAGLAVSEQLLGGKE